MNYLGVPLDSFIKAYIVWNPFLGKKRRLLRWKKLYSSKGGRIILIQSMLS